MAEGPTNSRGSKICEAACRIDMNKLNVSFAESQVGTCAAGQPFPCLQFNADHQCLTSDHWVKHGRAKLLRTEL